MSNDQTNRLRHLAIIMDGNRRWARRRGLPAAAGHRKGAETLEQVCRDAKDLGIKYLTLYAFSTENWQRDAEEVATLMGLLREYLKNDLQEIQKNNVRIIFIGERGMLDKDIADSMQRIENQTVANTDLTLCLAVSYGARQEILNAVKRTAKLVRAGEIKLDEVDEHLFSNLLYTKDIPDPDLVVRTSGERRISNYLLWQVAYAEFYFSEVLWPDFNRAELEKIIADFEQGKTDILIGTQMVSKGLDFDHVSIVGILNADTMLNYPDFRSYERAFQLMAQVAGRAGRKNKRGRVVLQTKSIDHPIIHQVIGNNYEEMVDGQLAERQMFHYPPYYRLVYVYLKNHNEALLDQMAAVMADKLRTVFGNRVLGPDKPPVARIQTLFIKKIVLKIEQNAPMGRARELLLRIQREMLADERYKSLIVYYDVDPM